jgi:hypothetical protein
MRNAESLIAEKEKNGITIEDSTNIAESHSRQESLNRKLRKLCRTVNKKNAFPQEFLAKYGSVPTSGTRISNITSQLRDGAWGGR